LQDEKNNSNTKISSIFVAMNADTPIPTRAKKSAINFKTHSRKKQNNSIFCDN
jgi:hypothetical protein